jgi:hypothetical protein
MNRLSAFLLVAHVALAASCGPRKDEGPPIGVSTKDGATVPLSDKPTAYAFDPLDDERPVNSDAHRGKPVVMAFVTTGDLQSQAQVGFLNAMHKNDGDRVHYVLVAVHPRKEIILVETYRKATGVEFPVALADGAAMSGAGPFGEIAAVPTVVVLDRFGKLVWKHTGLAKADEIRAQVRLL